VRGALEARVGAHMAPGVKGTRKLLRDYGARLVCVRYRYDAVGQRRLKTVEIVVEEVPWTPPERRLVLVAVKAWETALHARLKKAGGRWTGNGPFWRVRHDRAVKLGLAVRIRAAETAAPAPKKLLPAETKKLLSAEAPTTRSTGGFYR
jgi:hypothetical protein